MSELIVARNDGSLISRHSLAGKGVFTIGRSPKCDLTLEAGSISRHHALLLSHEGKWLMLDTGSTTGVHGEDGPIDLVPLKPESWIRIGPAYLWFNPGDNAGLEMDASVEISDSPTVMLRGVDLRGLPLFTVSLCSEEDRYTIGRSDSCQITLSDQGTSRLHAVCYREYPYWYIADVNSSGGTLYDGRRIIRKRLRNGGFIRVGETIISVCIPENGDFNGSGETEAASGDSPVDIIDDPSAVSSFLDQAPRRPSG